MFVYWAYRNELLRFIFSFRPDLFMRYILGLLFCIFYDTVYTWCKRGKIFFSQKIIFSIFNVLKKCDKRYTLQSAKQGIWPEHFKDILKIYLKSIFSEYDIYSCLTFLFIFTYMCVMCVYLFIDSFSIILNNFV